MPPSREAWAAVRVFDGGGQLEPRCHRREDGIGKPDGRRLGSPSRHRRTARFSARRFSPTPISNTSIAYDIVEGPLPCRNYISTHRFIPITEGDRTLGIWQAEFECNRDDEAKLDEIVGDGIYVAGMKGLNEHLVRNAGQDALDYAEPLSAFLTSP